MIGLGMVILVAVLIAATVTDVSTGRIPNVLTYSGMLLALVGAVACELPLPEAARDAVRQGWGERMPGLIESILGWALCGGLMVFCYAIFAGQVGGGDVKLLAMVGGFLGPYAGLEALLWTFVIGATFALLRLIWKIGIGTMLQRGAEYAVASLRAKRPVGLDEQDRAPLKTPLYLAPCTLAAVLAVEFLWPLWSS